MSDTLSHSISFNGHASFEDFKSINQSINTPKKSSVMVTIALVSAILLQIWLIEIGVLFRIFSLIGTGILLWLILRGIDKAMLNQQKKQYESSLKPRTGLVSSTGIHLKFDETTVEVRWSSFVGFKTLDHLLVLVDKDKEFLGLAPYMFSSQNDWDSLLQLVESRLRRI